MVQRSEWLLGTDAVFEVPTKCFVFRFSTISGNSWTARTSGVILIAGVGSFFAYRFCSRLLGPNFLLALYDAAHLDTLNRTETKLLHVQEPSEQEQNADSVVSMEEFEEAEGERTPKSRHSVHLVGPDGDRYIMTRNPKLRRLRSPAEEGLAAIVDSNRPTSSRTFDEMSATGSTMTEASRIRRGERPYRLCVNGDDDLLPDDFDDDDNVSLAPSEASGIRLIWDADACWDDEFAGMHLHEQRPGSSASSHISELSAFKNIQNMFDSAEPGPSSMFGDEAPIGDTAELARLIHAKCTRNSNYMYHSVIVAEDNSDVVSVCSTRSGLSALRDKHARRSQGLWELSSRTPSEKMQHSPGDPCTSRSPNPMTDSGISKSSFRTTGTRRSSRTRNQMTDSAIDTGFLSSDDDSVRELASQSHPETHRATPTKSNSGIYRRANLLDDIKEQPSPARRRHLAPSQASVRSLEWCDEL